MKKRARRKITTAVFLLLAGLFVIKFAGISLLKFYIESGVGTCKTIPALCVIPEEKIIHPDKDVDYIDSLISYEFAPLRVKVPKEFKVIKQEDSKSYYKKKKDKTKGSVIYLLYEPRDFFVGLFPKLKYFGIDDDYKFIRRVMYAHVDNINNLIDAFFVVMKGIFIPDLGTQQTVQVYEFDNNGSQRGFIGANFAADGNYFNCDVLTEKGYFKIYIKDKINALTLQHVLSIIANTSIEEK